MSIFWVCVSAHTCACSQPATSERNQTWMNSKQVPLQTIGCSFRVCIPPQHHIPPPQGAHVLTVDSPEHGNPWWLPSHITPSRLSSAPDLKTPSQRVRSDATHWARTRFSGFIMRCLAFCISSALFWGAKVYVPHYTDLSAKLPRETLQNASNILFVSPMPSLTWH